MRDNSIDCISGVLILYMIYRHCLLAGSLLTPLIDDTIFNYPLLFFMAWFFFKAGMYHRDSEMKDVLKRATDRLLVPYLVFSVIAIVITCIAHLVLEGNSGAISVIKDIPIHLKREGAVICNAPLWFLLSLFFVRLFFSLLHKYKIPIIVILTFSFLAGWLIYAKHVPIGLYFGDIAFGLLFFCLGFLLKEKQYNNIVFIASLPVYLGLLVFLFISSFHSGYDTVILQPYPLIRLFNLAGIIVINNVFRRLPKIQLPILARIGKESMTPLVTHFIILELFIYFNSMIWHLPTHILLFIIIASMAIMLPLFVHFFNRPRFQWMVGKSHITGNLTLINEAVATIGIAGIMIVMTVYVFIKVLSL